MNRLIILTLGIVFGAGLGVSGMTNPEKVLAFLDVTAWDPSLLLVMGAAVVINFFGFRLMLRKPQPLLSRRFHLPTEQRIDAKLVVGSVLFGIGWGLSGFCPGAAIAAVSSGSSSVFLFIGAMIIGMLLVPTVVSSGRV